MLVTFDRLFTIEFADTETFDYYIEAWAARYDDPWLKFTEDQWAPALWAGMEGQIITVTIPTWKKRFEILAVDFHELRLYVKEVV